MQAHFNHFSDKWIIIVTIWIIYIYMILKISEFVGEKYRNMQHAGVILILVLLMYYCINLWDTV